MLVLIYQATLLLRCCGSTMGRRYKSLRTSTSTGTETSTVCLSRKSSQKTTENTPVRCGTSMERSVLKPRSLCKVLEERQRGIQNCQTVTFCNNCVCVCQNPRTESSPGSSPSPSPPALVWARTFYCPAPLLETLSQSSSGGEVGRSCPLDRTMRCCRRRT